MQLERALPWLVMVGVACSAADDTQNTPSGAGASGGGPATATTGVGGAGGSTFATVGVGGGCATSCSGDLKKVVDCHGVVVETCGQDAACLNGVCGNDPCGAAEAAQASFGCDYWAIRPDVIPIIGEACTAVYVANTWDGPVHIEVERDGTVFNDTSFIKIPSGQGAGLTYQDYDPVAGLPVGEVAILFLSQGPGGLVQCPVPAAVTTGAWTTGTSRGVAFNVRTDRPVTAYSILPYGGGSAAATSATLLLPTSVWDTNYVAVNAYPKSTAVAEAQPTMTVVARENGTNITVLPKVAIVGGAGVGSSPANTPITYSLDAGEYLQISQNEELTGSPIQADKPIGLWGGASCLNVPTNAVACDSAHQQIPPVKALGTEYAAVRYRNRASASGEEAPPWRLVGAVDGTTLTWLPSTPPGAPTVINGGEVHEFMAPGPFVVSGQDADHPFYVGQYMTGVSHINSATSEGDPEWVNVTPVAQYLDRYVFFTDPTYSETSLVVVRRKNGGGTFDDVILDCAGALGGWEPLGDLEYTRIDLVTGNFQNVGACSNGRHEISSPTPFGVTVWGWGSTGASPNTQAVSYAYPAGASVQPINEVVVVPVPE